MAWIEKRGTQYRVYWRTAVGRGAPKTFEPFADQDDAERFVALVVALRGDYEAARGYVRGGLPAAAASPQTPNSTPAPAVAPQAGTGVILTLGRLFEHHLTTLTGAQPRTLHDYRRDFDRHIAGYFGHGLDVRLIRSGRTLNLATTDAGTLTISGWVNHLKDTPALTRWGKPTGRTLSPKTIRGVHGLLYSILEHAVLAEPAPLLAVNPCRGTDLPANYGTEMHFLEVDAIHALLDQLTGPWHATFLTLVTTGLRFGELAGLDVGAVHLDAEIPHLVVRQAWGRDEFGRMRIGQPKTRASVRRVSLPRVTVEALRPLCVGRPADAPVFRMPEGARLHHGNVRSRVFRPAVEAAHAECAEVPLGLRMHDLRHTHATHLVASRPITSVMARLGHESVTTTQGYLHLLAGLDAADARAVDDLLAPTDATPYTAAEVATVVDLTLPVVSDEIDDSAAQPAA